LGGKLPNLSTFVYSTDWVEIELLSMTNQWKEISSFVWKFSLSDHYSHPIVCLL
jgi:hypothetical protein